MKEYLRRIQKTSKETYIVSLPIEWIRKKELKPKDEVMIKDFDSHLIIKPYNIDKNVAILDYSKIPSHLLEQSVIAEYMKGYDKIIIKNTPHNKVITIKTFVEEYLLGAYTEYNPSAQEFNILIDIDEHQANKNKIILHLLYLLEWFLESTKEAIDKEKKGRAISKMDQMDKEVDKYYYLSLRLYSSHPISRYAQIIENICDALINIVELKRLSKKDREFIKETLNTLENIFEKISQYYTYKSIKELSSLSQELKKMNHKIRKTKYSYITEPIRLLKDLSEAMIDELI